MIPMCLRSVSILPGSHPFRFLQSTIGFLQSMSRKLSSLRRVVAIATLSIAGVIAMQISLLGCGMEAAPQTPSLQLPKTIPNLTANRTGNQVHLDWTTPNETTDRLKLKGMVQLRLCRQPKVATPCETIATVSEVPEKPAQYIDVLPPSLTTGAVRPITYRIFGINQHGKTAGPSNVATVLAGEAPPEVRSLSAQVVERGVVLHWQPVSDLSPETSIQIDRTLLTPAAANPPFKPKTFHPLPDSKEPTEQKLRVNLIPADSRHTAATDPGVALDPSAEFGQQYRYSASRVVQQQVSQQNLQLASSLGPAVEVATRDTFPPAPPSGLVAIPVSAIMSNGKPEVDLSWSANTEADLAQYRVYRRDANAQQPMQRIAPETVSGPVADNVVAPAFRDTHVQAGQTYTYAVTAVDTSGNESRRSAEVSVTVPTS
jgi:hypothetical protein